MTRPTIFLAVLIALAGAAPASAATLDILVRDTAGNVVPDAVVMVNSEAVPPGRPIRFPWPYVVAQQGIAFQPAVLIVPVGAQVSFPNRDKVRHHVYSFSRPKPFELKLYGREDTRTVLFDKPGAVALGCNIHDAMAGFVMVVDTPFAARTDAAGRVSIANVPGGAARLRVWHPRARLPGAEMAQPIAVPQTGALARIVALPLRPAARG